MPLSDYFALEWYGPCCAAGIGNDSTPTAVAGAQVNLSMGGVNTSVPLSPLNALTNGRKLAAVNTSVASSPLANVSIRLRLGAVGKVNELTQTDIVSAVWGAIAAQNNQAGTMGEKINAAGAAGDPWSTALPGSYVDGTAGAALTKAGKALQLGQFIALK